MNGEFHKCPVCKRNALFKTHTEAESNQSRIGVGPTGDWVERDDFGKMVEVVEVDECVICDYREERRNMV